MRAYVLSLSLLVVVAFSLATAIEPWFQKWEGSRSSDNILQVALGDSRRLFANHFFVKSDVYFHSGYYPTIFDNKEAFVKSHEEEHTPDDEEDHNFLGKPKDWIDRFSRHFYPARHTHLGDSGCGHSCCQRAKADKHGDAHADHADHEGHDHDHAHEHDHDHDHGEAAAAPLEREILPWLRLSADMDPQRVETYVIGAYWLRGKLGKVQEAELFLREGLRANPGDCELLYELGRIYHEEHKDYTRARNVLELAWKNARERETGKTHPNRLLLGGILNQLALLEREQNNYPRAIEHYKLLKGITSAPGAVQAWIDYLKTNGPPIAAPGKIR